VGAILGNVLPLRAVSALSVGLYGMFLAIIIPPAKKNRVVGALVAVSFAASYMAAKLPLLSSISSGTRIIVLTVVLAAAAERLKTAAALAALAVSVALAVLAAMTKTRLPALPIGMAIAG
jgi:ABC-type molybdate transport system permease subunit